MRRRGWNTAARGLTGISDNDMNKHTVYIETSVISYLTARQSRDPIVAAQQRITKRWWKERLPESSPYISMAVLDEISMGDAAAAKKRKEAVQSYPLLDLNRQVLDLATAYFSITQLPEKARMDSYHLALAAFHSMTFLVSWNFKHILGASVRKAIQDFNDDQCIRTPIICNPSEMLEDENA